MLYRSMTTLARALAQYLLVLSRLPGHLRLPPEKETDTVKFVVTTLEVSGHLGTRCPVTGTVTRERKAVLTGSGSCAVWCTRHLIPA